MLVVIVRRAAFLVAALVAASLIIFWALAVLGGDAATAILGRQASPEALHALRDELGLYRPLWLQYLDWASGFASGDLGTSAITGLDVAPQIGERVQVTLPLAGLALGLTLAIGLSLGLYAAARHRTTGGQVVGVLGQLGMSLPDFWIGVLLVATFSVTLGWLPATGFAGWSANPIGSLKALVLPATALAVVQGAILTRYVRLAVVEVMSDDMIRTARAKGLSQAQALRRHGLRNAAIPVVTIVGLQLVFLVGGAIIVERVFFLPGLGDLILTGIERRDVPLVQSASMIVALFVLGLNFTTDVVYALLDPRLRGRRT